MKARLIPAHLLLIVARLSYAALFLWAAFSKILDPDQFSLEVARYQIIGPRASGVVGAMLPWTEFVIGACLLIGVCTAGAWLGTVCLFAVFAVARASVLHRGLSIDCGCGVMDGAITVRSLVLSISLFLAALAAYIAEVLKHGEARPIANRRLRSAASAIPTRAGNSGNASLAVIGAVVVAALCMPRATWGQANVSPATRLRLQACRSLQPAFDRIVGEHDRDVDIIAFTRRLAAMEDVAEAISQQIRLRQSSLLDQSLATVGGAGADAATEDRLLDASQIVQRFEPAFATPILLQDFPENDRQTLRQYLRTVCRALSTAIASRGRSCVASAGVDSGEVMRLAFVLPVLASESDQDLSAPSPPLPQWMSSASAIHLLRLFALESDRPRLAFALSRPPTTQTAASSDASAAYVAFARQQADALLRGQQYQAALFCLRDAIAIATAANDETAAIDLYCRVADVLETTDSPGVAAEEMAHVRSICRDSTEFSRASVLHLKYLYEAGQDEAVVAEAITDERDPRCGVNLPEVMYTAWLACLRTPKAGSADEWCKAFLEHFPDHPLAVHLYFAAATSALAAGNTDEASRLLSFIEFHFPQSRMIDKVHQIKERLRAGSGANASGSP